MSEGKQACGAQNVTVVDKTQSADPRYRLPNCLTTAAGRAAGALWLDWQRTLG